MKKLPWWPTAKHHVDYICRVNVFPPKNSGESPSRSKKATTTATLRTGGSMEYGALGYEASPPPQRVQFFFIFMQFSKIISQNRLVLPL